MHDTIGAYLTTRDIAFERVDEETYLFRLAGDGDTSWFTSISAVVELDQVIVLGELPVAVPPPCRRELGVWSARANRGLPVGNFEVDLDNGGVWAKTSIDVEDDALSDALLENLVGTNHALVGRFLPSLAAWLAGDIVGPDEAAMAAQGFDAD